MKKKSISAVLATFAALGSILCFAGCSNKDTVDQKSAEAEAKKAASGASSNQQPDQEKPSGVTMPPGKSGK